MTAPPIPATIDELTCDWLNEALAESLPDAQVRDFSTVEIGSDSGFMGSLARVALVCEGSGGPESLIVKFTSSDEHVRAIANFMRAYEREIMFYRDLSAEAPCRAPHHWFSAMDPGAGNFILGIEDMREARIGDQVKGASKEDAFDVVRMLARLHARYRESQRLSQLTWMPGLAELLEMALPILTGAQEPFRKKFGESMAGDTGALQKATIEALPAFIAKYAGEPNTVIHMDPRLDNIAFEEGSGTDRVRLFDWQAAVKGPAIYDLMYFVVGSIPTGLRQQIETDLIEAYLDELTRAGVPDYSAEALWSDYRHALAAMLAVILVNGEILKDDRRHDALGRLIVERYTRAMLDHDTRSVLKALS